MHRVGDLAQVKVLIGVDYPENEGDSGEREEQAVDAVKDTSVARDDVT